MFEFLVAGEREHPVGKGFAALCPLGCVFQQRYGSGVARQALAQQFETAKDRRQQIIKIVGDAAG
jgi:hypothetical protein